MLKYCIVDYIERGALHGTEFRAALQAAQKLKWLEGYKCLVKSAEKLDKIRSYTIRDICTFTDLELLRMLLHAYGSHWSWKYAILGAATNPDLDVLKFVMSKMTWDITMLNPLEYAVRGTCVETVRFLVEEGYLSVSEAKASTVFQAALCNGTLQMVKYLVSKGLSVCNVDGKGSSALHLSVQNSNNLDVTRYLLEAFDLDANGTDEFGRTPLEYQKAKCILSGRIRRLLLDHGASEDVNDQQDKHQVSRKRERDNNDLESKNSPFKKQRS